jgi:phosphatidylglycerol---prolipoprotein diacylglyceryl transferase
MLLFIDWSVNPEIINVFGFSVRWYGLCFATAFLFGYQILSYMFKQEGRSQEEADNLLIYVMVATVIGARMGHYFFYEKDLLLRNPFEFFKEMIIPPYKGLASHGATVGILTGLYLYARKYKDSFLKVTDRIVVTVASGGAFIRFGNLMNSEIVGKPTEVSWGFIFRNNGDVFARHPSQLYESLSCWLLFFILFFIWKKYKSQTPRGLLLGIFLIYIFGLRFFYEFLKENQVSFEDGMSLNMGQWLSIPAVLFGVGVLIYGSRFWKTDREAANKLG